MIDFPFLSFPISYINMAFLKVIAVVAEDLSRPRGSWKISTFFAGLRIKKKSRAFGSKIHATDENVNDMSVKWGRIMNMKKLRDEKSLLKNFTVIKKETKQAFYYA